MTQQKKKMIRFYAAFPHYFLLLIFIILFGVLAIILGQDANWDLRNYHFYNGYAFLFHRIGWDVAPADEQSFLNPFFDVLNYLLIATFPPWGVCFLLGAISGLNSFLIYKIASLIFEDFEAQQRIRYILFSFFIGITGTCAIGLIGVTTNDSLVALFVLISLYCLIKTLDNLYSTRSIAFAGLVMGVAVGFKLVAACYGIGMLVAYLLVSGMTARSLSQLKLFFLLAATMMVGFLVANGYWMFYLYQNFHNPFFPYYNNLFHSPFAIKTTFSDYRFFPQHYFTLPFWLAFKNDLTSEATIREWRFAVVYLLMLFYFFKNLVDYGVKNTPNQPYVTKIGTNAGGITNTANQPHVSGMTEDTFRKTFLLLLIFSLTSYFVWFFEFTIYRYLLPLELLSGILIVSLTIQLISSEKIRQLVLWACILLFVTTTIPYNFGRVAVGKDFFDVHPPSLPPQSTVILTSLPLAYTIPFFQKDAHFIAIPFFLKMSLLNGDKEILINHLQYNLKTKFLDPLIYNNKNLYSLSVGRNSTDLTNLPRVFWTKYVLSRKDSKEPWTLNRLATKDKQTLLEKMELEEVPELKQMVNRFPADKLSNQLTGEEQAAIKKIMSQYEKNTPFKEYYNAPTRALYYQYGLLRDEASCISFATHMRETLELCRLKKMRDSFTFP